MRMRDANLVGHLNILEGCRPGIRLNICYACFFQFGVYGLNRKTPFSTTDSVDHPVSSMRRPRNQRAMSHSYAHLYGLALVPDCVFYCVWPVGPGPDMALFKFTKATWPGKPIDV